MAHSIEIRRFEMGASAEGLDGFLERRGYRIASNGSKGYRYWPPGSNKAKMTSKRGLLLILDKERVAMGLEPILKNRLDR
jgi:hypothetical protein